MAGAGNTIKHAEISYPGQIILNVQWDVILSLSKDDVRRGLCPHDSTGLTMTSSACYFPFRISFQQGLS
ncbi:hypothetical protein [Mucilaginibacter sp.]|uniref:hypothetical protein n=1 Tax=Mucilaginibacter sp. TaxID=1882438 RepID=UPI002607DC72|nr:hypothetical protein [Mucilaginibacter sp.]